MALISADESETLTTARRVVRGLAAEAGYRVLLALLAAAAAVTAVSGGPVWRPRRLLVVGAAGIVQLAVPALRPAQSLGHLAVPRITAFAAASLLLVQTAPATEARWIVALTVCAAMGMVLLEPLLHRAVRARQAFAAHLPGISAVPRLTGHAANYVAGSFLLLCWLPRPPPSAGRCGSGPRPWWWPWGFYGATAMNAYRRATASRAVERNLGTAVREYAPDFIIYTARPDDASYQVAMWLPYLRRTGKKFIIVTRSLVPAEALAGMTDAPVVMRRRVADLDDVVVPSVSAVFYVNASSGNGAMVRYSELTHVYLGHGDSDKPPSYNPTHAMYDRIFAAGEAATRRYAAHGVSIAPEKFGSRRTAPARGHPAGNAAELVLARSAVRSHVARTCRRDFFDSLPVGKKSSVRCWTAAPP